MDAPYLSSVPMIARKIAFASFVTLTLSVAPLQELQLSQVVQTVLSPK